MIGHHWNHTIILGKGLTYDLNTCLLSPDYAYSSDKIFFLHLKEGVLYPISPEEARNVSYVARFILLQRAFINPPTFDTSRDYLKFYLFLTPSFVISRQIAVFLHLKWPLAWGLIGTICLLAYSILGLRWRTTAQAREIANTPNNLIKPPLNRKPTCMAIASEPRLPPAGPFQELPTELNILICLWVAKIHDLRPFSTTCRWATQFYHQASELKPILHLEGMPTSLSEGVCKKLSRQVFDNIQFMSCTSELLKEATNLQNQYPTPPHKWQEKQKQEEEQFKNLSKLVPRGGTFPTCLPTLRSVLARTFFITVNPDWLGNHKFLRTVTAAGTPAFIFVYKTDYEFPQSSRRFYRNNSHVLILTQPSPLRPHEWGIVLQGWACGEECVPITPFRGALNSNHYLRLAFDQEGRVIPECQAVWEWLMRFLEGQEVGFFHEKEDFYPEDPQQRHFMQFEGSDP